MTALIITPYLNTKIKDILNINKYDFIICADTAYKLCEYESIVPNLIIGDFDHEDSIKIPELNNCIVVPKIKNDTDTMLCVKKCIELNYKDITIIGGLGGRFDHTFANIQTLLYGNKFGCNMSILTKDNKIYLPIKSEFTLTNDTKYFSIFSISDKSKVKIDNAFYSGVFELSNDFPLGVSNEFINKQVNIEIISGTVLIIKSNE